MLDIRNLERRWLKYKIKSYAPYLGAAFLLLISLIVVFSLLRDSDLPEATVAKEHPDSPAKTAPLTTLPKNDENPDILEPSMDFVQSFQTSLSQTPLVAAPTAQNTKPLQQSIPVPKVLNVPESTLIKTPTAAVSTLSGDTSFSLNRNESKIDIQSVERRFKETSNPNLGLFIARYHYDHGNYSEAYNFSLKTNNLNNKIDESWIIFSKSLIKLGRAEQAKKTLQLYISDSNSESARSLLDSIERGAFK